MTNLIITCYPRSGSTFLDFYFQLRFGKSIARDHIYRKKKNYDIIGIVRDPVKSISSCIAMQEYYYEDYIVDEQTIEKEIAEYAEACRFLINKASIIIECDRLSANPENEMQRISNRFNMDIVSEEQYQINLVENSDWSFLPSSEGLPRHAEIGDMLSKHDMSECYRLYEVLKGLSC